MAGEMGETNSYRVVIVEDEPDTGETLRVLLELLGHRVEVARDAWSGLRLLRLNGADAVLCDLSFPNGPSGLDFATEVRGSVVGTGRDS